MAEAEAAATAVPQPAEVPWSHARGKTERLKSAASKTFLKTVERNDLSFSQPHGPLAFTRHSQSEAAQ